MPELPPAGWVAAPSATRQRVPRSRRVMIGYWVLFGVALTTSVMVILAMPAFAEIFGSFGADVPMATAWLLRAPWVTLLLPAAVLVPAVRYGDSALFAPETNLRYARGLAGLWAAFGLMLIAVVLIVYLPIFRLGTVV